MLEFQSVFIRVHPWFEFLAFPVISSGCPDGWEKENHG